MASRRFPLTKRMLAFVLFPLLAGWFWLHASLGDSLPSDRSLLLTQGLTAPVSLVRDEHGVPHIRSASDTDAYFAVGYAHAQDRLWQLELQRRMAHGRLSEVFGGSSVDDDVWFRTLGLYEAARTAWPALSPEAQRALTAYAAGVNSWIAENHGLPSEFRVLGIAPEPWTELDSLAWIKVFALDLGGNFRQEMRRFVARQNLSEEQLSTFFPGYPQDGPTTVADADLVARRERLAAVATLQDRLEDVLRRGGRYVGSNAWAVAGRHTADGSALLANDPHLGLQIPSLWYVVDIESPQLRVAGMTLVGLPVVVFGRNARIAWGGTNMMADTQDLYFEQIDPADASRYQAGARTLAFESRDEIIAIRADFPQALRRDVQPVTLQVRATRNGPLISDHFGAFARPVALRWTALDAGDTSFEAFYRLGYAQDWNGFKAAMSVHVAPAMNMLYADRDGNIGYLGAGRLPTRRKGEGTEPMPGWDDAYAWSGSVPSAAWPQSYNPASGYIVSANNKVVGDDYPYFISHDWAPPARARRIEQLLRERIDAGGKLSAQDMQRMQGDTVDLEAVALLPELLKTEPSTIYRERALEYLKTWDGDMRGDSQAATIFMGWMRHLRHRLFGDQLRGNWNNPHASNLLGRLAGQVELDSVREILRGGDSPWCDDIGTPERETCRFIAGEALGSALWEIYKLAGDDTMASWNLDTVQKTYYAHIPFSRQKPLDRVYERRIGNGGSENSINVAASDYVGAGGYLQDFGPGFRQVMQLGRDGIAHYYMNSTGQSGDVMSRHYDDMVQPFRDVQLYRLEEPRDEGGAAPRKVAHAGNGAVR